jgi:hypothetical protein
MVRLSKSKLLSFLQCAKRLHMEVHRPELLEIDAATDRAFRQGHIVGDLAQHIYGEGTLVTLNTGLDGALRETQTLLSRRPRPRIFEATFQQAGVLVRADVLEPGRRGMRLIEIKSSTKYKDPNHKDLATQVWVARQAGVPLQSYRLAHIDTRFVYPGDGQYDGLLKEVDISDDVEPLVERVPAWIAQAQKMLSEPEPEFPMGSHCSTPHACPFQTHCAGPQPKYPLKILPRISARTLTALQDAGYEDIRDIPAGVLGNPNHIRVWQSSVSGAVHRSSELSAQLKSLAYPRRYIDFETIQFAVPIWAGTRPYEQIPFQWSCHTELRKGEVSHTEFLADGAGSPHRTFAETLLNAVGSDGPVLVYSHFESTVITSLMHRFPDLAQPLGTLRERLVDLLPLVREHYYHPDMMGSWSIKSVLPTIAPELSYDTLDGVHDGGQAQDAFREYIEPATVADRRNELSRQMLDYCARDTEAMVIMMKNLSL